MPTILPRHTITETPPVRDALEELRRIAGMVRTRSFPYEMDVAAAADVKRLGLIAAYE